MLNNSFKHQRRKNLQVTVTYKTKFCAYTRTWFHHQNVGLSYRSDDIILNWPEGKVIV